MLILRKITKKVDTDLIAAIVAVVIAAILGWVEKLAKNVKAAKAGSAHAVSGAGSRKPAPSVAARKTTAKKRHVWLPARQERPSAPSIAIGNEEGVRVTADIQEDVAAAAPAQQPRLKPLDADGLRSAVLWGEILQRKF